MQPTQVTALYRDLPRLETQRLVLRPASSDDAADVHAYASDPQVTRYLRWAPHATLAQTEAYIAEVLADYRQGVDGPWAIESRSAALVIGHIHLMEIDVRHLRAQVGFVLLRELWNQGLATEALREVLAYALGPLGLNRVEGLCISANGAAARVMEKTGMRREGVLREYLRQKGVFWDFDLYALLRSDL